MACSSCRQGLSWDDLTDPLNAHGLLDPELAGIGVIGSSGRSWRPLDCLFVNCRQLQAEVDASAVALQVATNAWEIAYPNQPLPEYLVEAWDEHSKKVYKLGKCCSGE